MAAARATAEVSEPPRPRVVIRLSSVTPWNPAITATSPLFNDANNKSAFISLIRALLCMEHVESPICQPSQERAGIPIDCNAKASRPDVTCSPDETTESYSLSDSLLCKFEIASAQPTNSLV